jgi:hypothetical protein
MMSLRESRSTRASNSDQSIVHYPHHSPASTRRAGRHTINKGAVSVVTILLGWTVLGWIIALAMAAGGTTEEQLKARSAPASAPMAAAPVISPDGKSWWNGKEWVPLPPASTQLREVRPMSPPE